MSDRRINAVNSLIEKLNNDYDKNKKEVFRIHPSITFVSMKGGATGGICVRTNKRIKVYEELMIIPNSAEMSMANVLKRSKKHLAPLVKQVKNKLIDILPITSNIEDHLLAFVIMYASSTANKENDTKGYFKKHMAYMPSHNELRNEMQMCLYWTKEQLNVLGGPKSCIRRQIEILQKTVKLAFHEAIYPVLQVQSLDIQEHFIMSSVSEYGCDFKSTEECLLESYLAAFAIVQSRLHEGEEAPSIIPLIDLLNGVSDWSRDPYDDGERCNVAIKFDPEFENSTVLCARRNIKAGEELLISYGNLSPSIFLVGYGIIPPHLFPVRKPEVIGLLCPPDMIPTDERRIVVLEKYLITEESIRNTDMCILYAESYYENEEGNETDDIRYLCHLLWIILIATDEEIDLHLETGCRSGLYSENSSMCEALCKVIDYNMTLLVDDDDSSTTDGLLSLTSEIIKEEYARVNRNDIPLCEKYALRSRIGQRETLIKWRSHFCRRQSEASPADDDSNLDDSFGAC